MHYGIHVEWERMQWRRAFSVSISQRFSLSRALPSLYGVSDVTVIHYYGFPNANARINIYYISTKFSGYWDYPAKIFRGVLLCNIWHLKFKFYKALQVSHGRSCGTFLMAGRWSALPVNIVFYYVTTLYYALLNL